MPVVDLFQPSVPYFIAPQVFFFHIGMPWTLCITFLNIKNIVACAYKTVHLSLTSNFLVLGCIEFVVETPVLLVSKDKVSTKFYDFECMWF